MNSVPHQFAAQPPWFSMPPPSCASFWNNLNVRDRLRDLQETLDLAKSMYVFVRNLWNTTSQLTVFFFSLLFCSSFEMLLFEVVIEVLILIGRKNLRC